MTFNDSTEAFQNAPTYEDKASQAPIKVRDTNNNEVLDAMYWPGSAEKATPVIDWILLNDETARWHEASETTKEVLAFDTFDDDGDPITAWIPTDSWILRHEVCGFMYCPAKDFGSNFTHL